MSEKPSYYKCTKAPADSVLFTVGTAYEVHSYETDGRALLATDHERKMAHIPLDGHSFKPHDPWARYRPITRAKESDSCRQRNRNRSA
jgi:hypothetical protein